jgi:ketosteroid isomerase-like protein
MTITEPEIREFFETYEAASNTREWAAVADLIHPDAFYRFTDGDFAGLNAIRGAFEKTWSNSSNVQDERYYLTDLKIISTDVNSAVVTYTFNWAGMIEGKQPFSVRGRGTNVIVRNGDKLLFIHEHLSR